MGFLLERTGALPVVGIPEMRETGSHDVRSGVHAGEAGWSITATFVVP
jgi:hypothetical protein